MAIKKVQAISTAGQDDLQRVVQTMHDRTTDAINRLAGIPTLDGNKLSGVVLVAGIDNFVNHGLGRDYLGWHVSDRNPDAGVFLSATTNKSPEKYLILNSNADTTVALWVF